MTRKTWHYDEATKQMVEGPAPRKGDSSGDGWLFSDRIYSGKPFTAPDGTVIDSRKKHREYMRRANVTTIDDYKGVWDEAAKRRADLYTEGRSQRAERIEALRAAVEKHSRG